jgi:hypothetical protein
MNQEAGDDQADPAEIGLCGDLAEDDRADEGGAGGQQGEHQSEGG